MRIVCTFWLAFGVLLIVGSTHLPGEPAGPDGLDELNQFFRSSYAAVRQALIERAGPVLLVNGDELMLVRGQKRLTVTYVPKEYHTLKAVAHAPLTTYLWLKDQTGPLDEKLLTTLSELQEKLTRAKPALAARAISAEGRKRSEQILTATREFITATSQAKSLTSKQLTEYIQAMSPLVLANAAESARLQLDALHRQTMAFKEQLTAAEWAELRVVVVGSAMPRKGNLALQYFARLLGEPGEGPRIIYAESLWDESKALGLLGTHLLDTGIGTSFFADPRRMHRDLLADAAAEYLPKLLPQ